MLCFFPWICYFHVPWLHSYRTLFGMVWKLALLFGSLLRLLVKMPVLILSFVCLWSGYLPVRKLIGTTWSYRDWAEGEKQSVGFNRCLSHNFWFVQELILLSPDSEFVENNIYGFQWQQHRLYFCTSQTGACECRLAQNSREGSFYSVSFTVFLRRKQFFLRPDRPEIQGPARHPLRGTLCLVLFRVFVVGFLICWLTYLLENTCGCSFATAFAFN